MPEEPYYFTISAKEAAAAHAWAEAHECKPVIDVPLSMGETFSYTFTPSMMGTWVTINCLYCGERKGLTDWSRY